MSVDAIGLVSQNSSATLPQSTAISQSDFLQILLTQRQFQDPLKPMDNEQFVAQLAQFSALEVNTESSAKLDTLLSIQSVDQALALDGKTVQVSSSGQAGTVSAVSFDPSTGEPSLTVKTSATTLT